MWKFIVDVVHDFVSSLQPDVGRGFLHVSNVFLFSQLQQSEEAREAELADVNTVTEEFTERLSEAEQRYNQVIRVSGPRGYHHVEENLSLSFESLQLPQLEFPCAVNFVHKNIMIAVKVVWWYQSF